jgi:antitoxin component YwqK of YwqJK toxin-antitoxin module
MQLSMSDEIERTLRQYKDEGCVFNSIDQEWIFVMKKTPNTITDEETLPNVVNRDYAHFHANRLGVVDIIHKIDPEKKRKSYTAELHDDDYNHTYTIGEVVVAEKFIPANGEDSTIGGVCYYAHYVIPYLYYETDVKDGVKKKWHFNGQLSSEIHYKDGMKHGVYKTWTDKGLLVHNATYIDDKCHGKFESFWHDGTPATKRTYEYGTIVGNTEKYNPRGELWSENDDEEFWMWAND